MMIWDTRQVQIHQIGRAYEEYEKLRTAHKEFESQLSILIEKISADVAADLLEADVVIERLFDVAKVFPRDEVTIE